jgi:hypothetical protein
VTEPCRDRKALTHPRHPTPKFDDPLAHLIPLEVAHHELSVPNRVDVVQRLMEEALELEPVALGDHRRDDLIEVQIGEAGGFALSLRLTAALKQDALKRHRRSLHVPGFHRPGR